MIGTYLLIAGHDLSVRVLDSSDVLIAETAVDEAQRKASLAHVAGAKQHNAVLVLLFRHCQRSKSQKVANKLPNHE